MWLKASLLIAVFLHGAGTTLAAEAEISLDRLVSEALSNSPEIARASRRTDAARALVPQAGTLPDPWLNFEYSELNEREVEYGIRQEIPFPGKLRLRGEVASKEAEQSQQEIEAVRRRVVAQLTSVYHELSLTYRSLAVLEQNRQILIDFEKTARTRYVLGQSAQQDVLRAQTELSRLLTRIAVLQQQRESSQAEINRLLNRPPRSPLGRPISVPLRPLRTTLEELSSWIERTSPMLRGQASAVERGDRALDLARREYFPDIELDLSRRHDLDMRTNGFRLMLSIQVPLYYRSQQREGVREATALRSAAQHELQATRQELLFQLKDNYVRAQRAEQLIRLLSEAVIPQAGLTLRSAQAGYAVGSVDFLTLLSSLLTLQENRLELEMETAEHAKARARLEEISGELP
jgi:outer membrane protein TolC